MAVLNGRITDMQIPIAKDGSGDLQVMFNAPTVMNKDWFFDPANTHLNLMAMHKPFDHAGIFIDDQSRLAANKSVRCGFGSIPEINPATFQSSPAQWSYQTPAGTHGHWRRVQDFEGYNSHASAPFLMVVSDQLVAGQELQVQILTNHRVDDQPGYNFEWADNVTLEELLMDSRQSGYFIHLFIKNTSGTGPVAVGTMNIVTVAKDRDGYSSPLTVLAPASQNRGDGVEAFFELYPDGDGNHCPAIPVLQGAVAGDTFAVCAAFGSIPDSIGNDYYKVYTSIPQMTWRSLNLDGHNNFASFAVIQLANNITGSISIIELVDGYEDFTDQYDNKFHKYIIKKLRASVVTGQLYESGDVRMSLELSFFDGEQGLGVGFVGHIENNRIVQDSLSESLDISSNTTRTVYLCDETTGLTNIFYWAMWDNDPDNRYYQLGAACAVHRAHYQDVNLDAGESNIVQWTGNN